MRPRPARGLRTAGAVLGAFALLLLGPAPAAVAAPSLQVSATTGLTDGQTITVSGAGFGPGLNLAVGQCRIGFKGPADCNTSGGATFRETDGSGALPTVTLKLRTTFGGVDCTKEQCVIGAGPLPNANSAEVVAANTTVVELTFGSPAPAASTSTAPAAQQSTTPTAAQQPAASTSSTAASGLPKTGWREEMVVVLLAGTALLLPGLGLLALLPSRRKAV